MLADLPRLAGSNAWAVSPGRSASGSALLATDPHLEVNRLPAIWYEVALAWGDGEYAMGATLPGCPIMAVGRTPRLAWGVTYMHADTSDFFIEDCRPGGATGWQYRRGDQWFDLQHRQEVIAARRGAEAARSLRKRAGYAELHPDMPAPASISRSPGSAASSAAAARSAPGSKSSPSHDGRRCNGCRPTLAPSVARLDCSPIAQGIIGLQASGWLPKRGGGNSGIVPIPAWDRENHWQGRVQPELLPRRIRSADRLRRLAPTKSSIARRTAAPCPRLPDYRKRRIVERLTEMHASHRRRHADVAVRRAQRASPRFAAGPARPVGRCARSRRKLADWDCSYTPDSTEATLFQHFYRHVVLEIFGHEQGIGWRRMFYLSTRMGYSTMVLTAIDRTLRKVTSLVARSRQDRHSSAAPPNALIQEPEETLVGIQHVPLS